MFFPFFVCHHFLLKDVLDNTACKCNNLLIIPIKPELKLTISQKTFETMTQCRSEKVAKEPEGFKKNLFLLFCNQHESKQTTASILQRAATKCSLLPLKPKGGECLVLKPKYLTFYFIFLNIRAQAVPELSAWHSVAAALAVLWS